VEIERSKRRTRREVVGVIDKTHGNTCDTICVCTQYISFAGMTKFSLRHSGLVGLVGRSVTRGDLFLTVGRRVCCKLEA
jgi:hypothetical protein